MEEIHVFDETSSRTIYIEILNRVESIMQSIDNDSNSEEIMAAQTEALAQLEEMRRQIKVSLHDLEQNAEWDSFIFAFYGETNAGKSTLIETLRILLGEKKKIAERTLFSQVYPEYKILCDLIKDNQVSIDDINIEQEEQLIVLKEQLQACSEERRGLEAQIALLHSNMDAIVAAIKKERTTSLRKFLRFISCRLPQQVECKAAKGALLEATYKTRALTEVYRELEQQIDLQNREFQDRLQPYRKTAAEQEEKRAQLEAQLSGCTDGRIIGDGRSDFTQKVQRYDFSCNGQQFTLLDLPGVEGNEKTVLDEINDAIQKAHAVFYVTSQPRPPQNGDKNSKGMLDKLVQHLAQQTEVYSVFNKRANHPTQLCNPLVSADDAEGIEDLNDVLHIHLGEQYGGCIPVSAYPAFLAVGTYWDERHLRKKEKFQQHFASSEIILYRSHVQEFSKRLSEDMTDHYKTKILKANLKKIAIVLGQAIEKTRSICTSFDSVEQDLWNMKQKTDQIISNAAEQIREGLETDVRTSIEHFKNQTRKDLYAKIDSDIGNKEFKRVLEKATTENLEDLQSIVKTSFDERIQRFQEDISDIVIKYYENVAELLRTYASAGHFKFEFSFNIKSKSDVKWGSLILSVITSIVSIVGLITGTGGAAAIAALALAIIGLGLSVYNAIASSLNHDFRKARQCESVNKILDDVGNKAQEQITKSLEECDNPLQEGIRSIKEELNKPIRHVQKTSQILRESVSAFRLIMNDVQLEVL